MKKVFKIYLPIIVLLGLIFLIFQPNPYLRRAIIYNTPDISDHEIFAERIVKSDKHQPWKISSNFNSYNLTPSDSLLFNEYKTVAFVVVKDTSIIFEKYWEGYSENSISSSFSMAKSVVGLLVGIAIDDGLISSVDDPVSKYIPKFENEKYNITIRDLLTMSNGLDWNETYSNPFSVTTKAYYGNNLNRLVLKSKSINPPNKKFEYNTASPQLLSIILKTVTNQTLSEYTSEKLWKPLGAKNDAAWSLDQKNGVEKAATFFNSNARDYARIGQLILNNGKWNGKQLISENYLKEALTPATYLVDEKNDPVDFYGYQWWICNYNDINIFSARGILGQYIISIPEKNIVIVRLGHKRDPIKINHHPADLYKYIDLALEITK